MKHISVLLSLVFACAIPACSAPLSRSIEFDRLLLHAHNAVMQGDYKSAAQDYGHAAKLDLGAPESFYLDYASTLGGLGRWKDAKNVLGTYFRRFDKQGELYDLALRRYVEAGDRVATHSEERIRPQLVGMADLPPNGPAPSRSAALAGTASWTKSAAPSMLPPMPVTQGEAPPGRPALQGMIGLYSGEARDGDESSRGPSCSRNATVADTHPASDCFYGFHRSMSLNAVDGSAVVGFVKVDYVRAHRSASDGDRKGVVYTRMEYYLAIRMWMTAGGLIQGQQRGLCEFVVDTQTCTPAQPKGLTPLRARMTADGRLGLESEKGGGLRVYTKVRALPDRVRPDVVRVIPSLGGFGEAPAETPDLPVDVQARPSSLGDTAGGGAVGDAEDDDSVAAGVSSTAREVLKASVVG